MVDATPGSERDGLSAPDLASVSDIVEVGNRYYVLASAAMADETDQVLKHDESFAVFDRYGDIKPVGLGEEGLYHEGTRHLSSLLLRIEAERPLLLGSTARRNNSLLSVDLTNPDMTVNGTALGHGTVHIGRSKALWSGGCYERLAVRNFARTPVTVPLVLHFAADFADIFEVRGVSRERRGKRLPAEVEDGSVSIGYDGLDGVRRRTRLSFDPPPATLSRDSACWQVALDPGAALTIDVSIACDVGPSSAPVIGFESALWRVRRLQRLADRRDARFESSSELFDEWIHRSVADLVMMTSETEHGPYPYAGVPWFSTIFGRDGIIVARQALWMMPELARGVLGFLAATQADEDDPVRDAQPGKIVHELRRGEMAATGEIPFGRYYGSHDATPLFVWLAAEYHRRTGDLEFARSIWGNVERALSWMEGAGDPDGDGFLDYQRQTPIGLAQQGWKDSSDSVFHADGRLAEGPTAMCEIQGYAYAARRGAAEMADALGEGARADELRAAADTLRERFEAAFWLEKLGTYALALDGDGSPCGVRSSNAGHCLVSGIASREHAAGVAESLMADASFSGWGVRTLAAGEPRYNPMSYHNGSIWPHDNAMVALGLARYGYHDHAVRILSGLFDASRHFDLTRLPELFCGFTRRDGEAPTLYPVACSPQAWAAGAPLMLLEACLGMDIDARGRTVRFSHGRLPTTLDRLRIDNLSVADARLDLQIERHRHGIGLNVLGRSGEVEVVTVK